MTAEGTVLAPTCLVVPNRFVSGFDQRGRIPLLDVQNAVDGSCACCVLFKLMTSAHV
jgi:hypothetical protein